MPQSLTISTGHCQPPNGRTAGRKIPTRPLSLSPGERNPRLGCPGVCQCGKGTAGGNPHPCQGAPSLKLWGAGGSPVDQEEPRPASCGCWFQIHPRPGREGGVLGQGPGGADRGPRGGSACGGGRTSPHQSAQHIRAPEGCCRRRARFHVDQIVITTTGSNQETIKG